LAATSSPDLYWLNASTIKSIYGYSAPTGKSIIEEKHRVRPTSGLEFISSRHFPDEVQGDIIINNTIGFLGTKMHQVLDDTSGFTTKHRLDLLTSSDPNFRPVDMEFAPDGSLYLVDWHNILVGHMQHNARDPLRDHVHGRIYRITYPSRPLVKPAKVDGASIEELLDNLKLPEYRTRYRSKRELREHDKNLVFNKLQTWLKNLDPKNPDYERYQLEGLWVSWGINKIDNNLLNTLLKSKDVRVRAAAVHVARFVGKYINNQKEIFINAANDESGRVRLEAMNGSTWLDKTTKETVLSIIEKKPMDTWIKTPYNFIKNPNPKIRNSNMAQSLDKANPLFVKGQELYNKEGFCVTCHQPNGEGLASSEFPPLAKSKWVTGNPDRLIKIILHGIYGPMEVNGKQYPGNVPMTPYGGMMTDEEVAAVSNYIRNAFGNADPELISPIKVKEIREKTKKQKGFYTAQELLKLHPDAE
jgi:mono/diheme cytochrome c family protein